MKRHNTIGVGIMGFLAITIVYMSCSDIKKDKDCSQFKKGSFVFHLQGEQGVIYFKIKRNDSIQTETANNIGSAKLAIKWTGKCTYELRLIETTFSFPDSVQQIRKTIPVKCEILSSTDDYYIFRSKTDALENVLTDTMWIDK